MASNSEANLSSDFDIDEVINWDEQNYSSKDIEFQLPQLGLPNDVKTSQNTTVTLSNLGLAVATTQQTSLQSAQNSGSFFSSFFGTAPPSNSVVRNSKNHGFSSQQTMVSPNALSFPSQNINIPPTAAASSNSSLLQFSPNLVGQNATLASQLGMSTLQTVQNSSSLMNTSPFRDHGIDDSSDLITPGPLDEMVDQILDRSEAQRLPDPPALTNAYDDDTPVITYSNRQSKAPQLSSRISPQNVPARSVLSPNAPLRNTSSPNLPTSQNIRTIPSPAPALSTGSPNILSSNPSSNVLVQNTTKVMPPNISPTNIPSQNSPSPNHVYSTIQGLSAQSDGTSSHSNFMLQAPVSTTTPIISGTMKDPPALVGKASVASLPIGQADSDTNSLFQTSGQRNNQSFPSFMLQNPNQTLICQATTYSPSSTQANPIWLQGVGNFKDLLQMQRMVCNSSPNIEQKEFTNQLARSSQNFSSILTNQVGNSQSNMPSFMATSERSPSVSSMNDLNLTTASSPSPRNVTSMNFTAANTSQYSRAGDLIPVSNILQTSVPHSEQVVSNFSSIVSTNTDQLHSTSLAQDIQNLHEALEPTKPLERLAPKATVSQFFQNIPEASQSTTGTNCQEKMFSSQNAVSNNDKMFASSQNVVSSNDKIFSNVQSTSNNDKMFSNAQSLSNSQSQVSMTTETVSTPLQSKSVFTLVPSTSLPNTKPSVNSPGVLFRNQTASSSQPAGITTIKITSPAGTATGFKYPTVGFAPKTVSIQAPRSQATRLQSPTTTTAFPTFRLAQGVIGNNANSPNKPPMVFTIAPGSNAAATLKNLPANIKDKLAGRQVIFVQQPSSQLLNTPKPQPVNVVFVNDNSIAQVVSGGVKSKEATPSRVQVLSPGSLSAARSLTESKRVPPLATATTAQAEDSSPASVGSADIDSIPIAALKQSEELKRKESDQKDGTEQKRKKRRKDPNRPVKPLSSFQRFFQARQPAIRLRNPQASFAEVSKTIKEMWESLSSKDKKVYQDAWRMERVQYKKAMEEYNAMEVDSDTSSSPKHVKTVEIKEDSTTTNPVPVSPVDIPIKTESNIAVSSPAPTTAVVSSVPAPRSTGKPLAMMAEMANKTKMATAAAAAAAAAKATGMTKNHVTKHRASNGIEDGHVVKKKSKINPIPKKLCVRAHCNKPAKTTKERGTMFCSDDCVKRHCRGLFKSWVETRRGTLQTAT